MPRLRNSVLVTKRSSPTSWVLAPMASVSFFQVVQSPSAQPSSIEDGCAEGDWTTWKKLTDAIGAKTQLVGDDLFVTNTEFLKRGIDTGTARSEERRVGKECRSRWSPYH